MARYKAYDDKQMKFLLVSFERPVCVSAQADRFCRARLNSR